jgi:predicted ester cyclase
MAATASNLVSDGPFAEARRVFGCSGVECLGGDATGQRVRVSRWNVEAVEHT